MIYVGSAQAFEAVFESGQTGLVGTVTVAVIDNDGNTVVGPTTTNITENSVGGNPTGIYTWNAPAAPATEAQYSIVWSPDGTFDPSGVSVEDLVVVAAAAGPLPPIPPPEDGGPASGPCSAWTTSDDAAACCTTDLADTSPFDDYVIAASEVLFELSGRRFAGICERTVRPCRTDCNCGLQVLSRGYVVGPWDWSNSWWWSGFSWNCGDMNPCGCEPLSRVLLPGYPVREITEVKIDGNIVDPSEYRLDERRWLTRMRDTSDPNTMLFWPSCQILDLPDTESGTFSITYTYGMNPPTIARQAANELACQFFRLCSSDTDCVLPANVSRTTRLGVTTDRASVLSWFYSRREERGWQTGMQSVDAFLSAYASEPLRRRPMTYSPDGARFAKYIS